MLTSFNIFYFGKKGLTMTLHVLDRLWKSSNIETTSKFTLSFEHIEAGNILPLL